MKHYDDIEAEDSFEMAVAWMRGGDLDRAEQCLKRAIDMNRNFIYAYITLARVYGRQKRFKDAVHVLKRASKLDPAFDRLNFLMAKYAWRAGDAAGALAALERAMEMSGNPLYPLVRSWMRGERP